MPAPPTFPAAFSSPFPVLYPQIAHLQQNFLCARKTTRTSVPQFFVSIDVQPSVKSVPIRGSLCSRRLRVGLPVSWLYLTLASSNCASAQSFATSRPRVFHHRRGLDVWYRS